MCFVAAQSWSKSHSWDAVSEERGTKSHPPLSTYPDNRVFANGDNGFVYSKELELPEELRRHMLKPRLRLRLPSVKE